MRRLAALIGCGLVLCPAVALAGGMSRVTIVGRGWGNGVGMSQWGAEGYALHGWSYRRIVAHYYPHTTIATAPDEDVRVLIVEQKPHVSIGAAAPFLLVDAHGRKVHVPARTLTFSSKL